MVDGDRAAAADCRHGVEQDVNSPRSWHGAQGAPAFASVQQQLAHDLSLAAIIRVA
jgi:hypothetical protein